MSKALYDIRNYPRRSGTSQPGRVQPVLQGDSVQIDERTIADYILFAHRLSQELTYYNLNNLPQGNWGAFLQADISFQLAQYAADAANQWEAAWNELMEAVEGENGGNPTEEDYQRYLAWRLQLLYTVFGKLVAAYAFSKDLEGWNRDLQALLSSAHINIIWFLLKAYHQSLSGLLPAAVPPFTFRDLRLAATEAVIDEVAGYDERVKEVLELDTPLFPDADFIFGTAASVPERIAAASEYLDDLAGQLIRLYGSVNLLAKSYLASTLTSFDAHQPHIGLFYAFLRLSAQHQSSINGLLLQHLDFYYKEVLQFRERSWIPDSTCVTFELAKNVDETFIAQGSRLSAGKDPSGKDIFYETTRDILVHKAEVAALRSYTLLKDGDAGANIRSGAPGVYALAAANSLDGSGKVLPAGQSWVTFRADASVRGDIGLSFYAPLLSESAGAQRHFAIWLRFSDAGLHDEAVTFIQSYGRVKVETENGPQYPDITSVKNESGYVKISFTIDDKTHIAAIPPNASLIFGNKFESGNENTLISLFDLFFTASIVELFLVLSNHLVKVLQVETAAGTTDASSPFPAFGGIPKVGSTFSVTEPLLAGRTLSSLSMTIEWSSDVERAYKVGLTYDGVSNVERPVTVADHTITTWTLLTSPATFATGSIQVKLKDDLGYATYANDLTQAILGLSGEEGSGINFLKKDSFIQALEDKGRIIQHGQPIVQAFGSTGLPSPPYTPVIKHITLTGTFLENITAAATPELYQQLPFGYKKVDKAALTLLPASYIGDGTIATTSEGELYIGLKNVLPAQSQSLLFALSEGSANPELQNPTVSWTYLKNNEWTAFGDLPFTDGTNSLIQTGIVSFVLPDEDVTKGNTLLPEGYFWLRAAVPLNQSSAVANVIAVHAQAALATFTDNSNDPAYLGSIVPAGTITNLSPKRPAVKKVTQPYPSFGGRQAEPAAGLYTRVSERLRHKGRGVTAWDYEHVILEAFPELYKVKVLHHACPYKGGSGKTEKILSKAGSTIVLVVPKTYALSTVYKPLVSKARLTAVYDFIKPRISPFVQLTVMNPLFEEVQVEVTVVFMPYVQDRLYHEDLLDTALQQYLSPWAFTGVTEPDFGGEIFRSAVLDFIEELPYVDFVTKLDLKHQGTSSGDIVQALSPASVLISAAAHLVSGTLSTESSLSNKETIGFC